MTHSRYKPALVVGVCLGLSACASASAVRNDDAPKGPSPLVAAPSGPVQITQLPPPGGGANSPMQAGAYDPTKPTTGVTLNGTGYPAQPGGVPGQQPGGYPGQQAGGYPGQQPGGYPGQQPGGYPSANAGYPNAGGYPSQTGGGYDPMQTAAAGTTPTQSSTEPSEDIARESLLGTWQISSSGGSCSLNLTLTGWTGGYRASTRGCTAPELQGVNAWSFDAGRVTLKDNSGSTLIKLAAQSGKSMSGSTTGGAQVTAVR